MDLSELVAAAVDLVLPGDCAGCGVPAVPWCPRCAGWLGSPTRPPLPGGPEVFAAGRYAGPLRSALLRYKERGRRDLARPLAELLAGPLGELTGATPGTPTWLVPAPSRPAAARARGGDHVARLCRVLAAGRGDVRVARALRLTRAARDSVGLDAGQRVANLHGRLRIRPRGLPPPGTRVVLVDDVVTTGATLRACRAALAGAGVRADIAIVLCDATPHDHEFGAKSYPPGDVARMSFGASTQVGVTERSGLLPNRDGGYRARHPTVPRVIGPTSGGSSDRAPGTIPGPERQPDAESEGSLRGDRCHRP